jgi:NADH-quinone oxidoreductase subunit J
MVETWQEILIWILGGAMIVAAVGVVTSRNVVHAALFLVGTLMGAAALYVMLFAEFVAWVQVLVYVGAVVVLMLFGLMLTRAPIGPGKFDNEQRLLAAFCSLLLFGVMAWILIDTFQGEEIALADGVGTKTETVGRVIFSSYVLPFEVVSVLLLAALIGAVVVARKDSE